MRVRRLLDRLDFLSELPEKLAAMINKHQYKEAVQLYNKSILVLTRHSHVLSFKNIKERTELMMADLTSKVIDLMDDSSLEAVKLTQYVVVLRLMKAPSAKVMTKLLTAHRNRSTHMILQFKHSLAQPLARFEDANEQLSAARQFHQSMIVSLIEACKGIRELYSEDRVEDGTGKEAREAYQALATMISGVMTEYKSTIVAAFRRFFVFFHAHQACAPGGTEWASSDSAFAEEISIVEQMAAAQSQQTEEGAKDSNDSSTSINVFAMQEERNSWLMLARQTILDVTYLDSTQKDCAPLQSSGHHHHHHHSSKDRDSSKSAPREGHAESFADAILDELLAHCQTVRVHIVDQFVRGILRWLPKLHVVVNACKGSAAGNSGGANLEERAGGNWTKNIPRLLSLSKKMFDQLFGQAVEVFSEATRSLKPVVDIYEAIQRDSGTAQAEVCVHFVDQLCAAVRKAAALKLDLARLTIVTANRNLDDDSEIYVSSSVSELGQSSDQDASSICGTIYLLLAGVLRKISPNLLSLMEEEFLKQGFPSEAKLLPEQRSRVRRSLDGTCQSFLTTFVETNRRLLAQQVEKYQSRLYSSQYTILCAEAATMGTASSADSQRSTGDSQDLSRVAVSVSEDILAIATYLDLYTVYCAMILGEQPPLVRGAAADRDTMRRASMRHNIGGGANAQSLTLQLDIDRLFSQKMRIFDAIEASSSMDVLVNAQLKAVLKSILEGTRLMTMPLQGYLLVQADVSFLKQAAQSFLKDLQDCDALVDQILSAVFSRYSGANDISSAADATELHAVTRAVGEAVSSLAETTALITVRGR